jgi:hypothetical protein
MKQGKQKWAGDFPSISRDDNIMDWREISARLEPMKDDDIQIQDIGKIRKISMFERIN